MHHAKTQRREDVVPAAKALFNPHLRQSEPLNQITLPAAQRGIFASLRLCVMISLAFSATPRLRANLLPPSPLGAAPALVR
jgi:hypothetical protein